jgi:cytochrome c553
MKIFILLTILFVPVSAIAKPSSQVAWTADELNFVKAGNPLKGKELAQACSGCHGSSGISSLAGTPSLAGQSANYVFKQLQDYAAGDRQHEIMSSLANTLSKQDIADLSSWFASLQQSFQSGIPVTYENARKLVKNGDNERILPPCEVCHGGKGQGQKMDIPALSGQNADYLAASLKAFKLGSRHNDIYSRMRLIAQTLTDEEIVELGYFYQNIKN